MLPNPQNLPGSLGISLPQGIWSEYLWGGLGCAPGAGRPLRSAGARDPWTLYLARYSILNTCRDGEFIPFRCNLFPSRTVLRNDSQRSLGEQREGAPPNVGTSCCFQNPDGGICQEDSSCPAGKPKRKGHGKVGPLPTRPGPNAAKASWSQWILLWSALPVCQGPSSLVLRAHRPLALGNAHYGSAHTPWLPLSLLLPCLVFQLFKYLAPNPVCT